MAAPRFGVGMRRTFSVAASLVVAVASCQSGGADANDRAIAIYSAVIRAVITHDGRPAPPNPVFILSGDPSVPLSLDVQAGIVEELHGFVTIRFVDERAEAIDESDPTRPVLEGGVLISLGRVPPGSRRVVVRAEGYQRQDSVRTYEVSVKRTGTTWTTVGVRCPASTNPAQALC